MSSDTFSSVNSILERDATDTTYKYSLLQAVIETTQEYPQFAHRNEATHRVQLPADAVVNLKKTDKIPSAEFLEEKREEILACWDRLHAAYQERFEKEISIGLLAGSFTDGWKEAAFQQLCENARYLIEVRGCNEWNG